MYQYIKFSPFQFSAQKIVQIKPKKSDVFNAFK